MAKIKIAPRLEPETINKIKELKTNLNLSEAVIIEKAIDLYYTDNQRFRLEELRKQQQNITEQIKVLESEL